MLRAVMSSLVEQNNTVLLFATFWQIVYERKEMKTKRPTFYTSASDVTAGLIDSYMLCVLVQFAYRMNRKNLYDISIVSFY